MALALAASLPLYRQEAVRHGSAGENDGEAGGGCASASASWLLFTLVMSLVLFCFDHWLDMRQHRRLQQSKSVPARLQSILGDIDAKEMAKKQQEEQEEDDGGNDDDEGDGDGGQEDNGKDEGVDDNDDSIKDKKKNKDAPLLPRVESSFSKSREYGLDKSAFGLWQSVFKQGEAMSLLCLGYMPFVWDLASQWALAWFGPEWGAHHIPVSLVAVLIFVAYDTVVSTPFSLYSTFVIEARHGFNKQTLGLWAVDKAKSLALTVVLVEPLLALVLYVIEIGGKHFYLYAWIACSIISVLMITIIPVWIMPLFNKFTPLEDGSLKRAIDALASRTNFPLTNVFVIDGSKRSAHSNAYFYGFFKNKRIVLFDTLTEQVSETEVVAVLGHELGHWKLWHTIQNFAISQVYLFVSFFVFSTTVMDNRALYCAFGFDFSDPETMPPPLIGLGLFSMTIWSVVDPVLSILMNMLSRKNEFQADAFAAELGFADALKTCLVKIHVENLGTLDPDPLYSLVHYSHPPLVERLAQLDAEKIKLKRD